MSGSFIASDGLKVSFDGFRNKELDYRIVQFEQTNVQNAIDKYKPKEFSQIRNELNNVMNGKGAICYLAAWAAPDEVKKVFKENFNPDNGQPEFDIKNYHHRVLLGQKIIDEVYASETKKIFVPIQGRNW